MEDGGRKSEVGGQWSVVSGQWSEGGIVFFLDP